MSWNLLRGPLFGVAASIVAFGVAACDGDGGPMTPPPPPMVTIQTVAVTAPVDSVLSGQTVQLSVTATDSNNQVVANPLVTWTSSDAAVAAVDANGLVSGQGEGSATITATVEGVAGTTSMSVFIGAFRPATNVTLSGAVEFTDVNIPAGVTITVTNDLVLTARNDVVIDGDIVGDCVGVEIASAQDITITGTVSGVCSAGPQPGSDNRAVRILAGGAWSVDDADVSSAGGILISNLAADLAVAEASSAMLSTPFAKSARVDDCSYRNSRFQGGYTSRDPAGGPDITLHPDVNLTCNGELFVAGGSLNGASGQDGADVSATVLAKGGDGDPSGLILLTGAHVTVWLAPLTITSGNGGQGGIALASGLAGVRDATAEGGRGGNAWLPRFRATAADGRVFVSADAQLKIEAGTPGNGGDAIAQAHDGADASGATPAEVGGRADALGGLGGIVTPADELGSSVDMFVGSSVQVISATLVNPPSLADGGQADAAGGNGGNGGSAAPDGAVGGGVTAWGGHGGLYGVNLPGGQQISQNGTGGPAFVSNGNGGIGFDGCSVGDLRAGGAGGKGGIVAGAPGTDGLAGPSSKKISLDHAGNGGPGGAGLTPGAGGASGDDLIAIPALNIDRSAGPNLTAGLPGGLCETAMATDVTVKDDPANHDPTLQLAALIKVAHVLMLANSVLEWQAETGIGFPLTGSIAADLSINASAAGALAGFTNILVQMTGILIVNELNRITGLNGVLTAGVNGGLFGVPVSYDVTSTLPAGSPGLDPAMFGLTPEQVEAGVAAGQIIRKNGGRPR